MSLIKFTSMFSTSLWANQTALVQRARWLEESRETKLCILRIYKAVSCGFVKAMLPTSASKTGFLHSAQLLLAQLDKISC